MQHSYVDCAAEPGRLSPGVSEPFGLLLAMVDLWERKYKSPMTYGFSPFSSFSNLMFVVIYLGVGGKEKEDKKNHQETEGPQR